MAETHPSTDDIFHRRSLPRRDSTASTDFPAPETVPAVYSSTGS